MEPVGLGFRPQLCTRHLSSGESLGGKLQAEVVCRKRSGMCTQESHLWGAGRQPGCTEGGLSPSPVGDLRAEWALQRCPQSRERLYLPVTGYEPSPREGARARMRQLSGAKGSYPGGAPTPSLCLGEGEPETAAVRPRAHHLTSLSFRCTTWRGRALGGRRNGSSGTWLRPQRSAAPRCLVEGLGERVALLSEGVRALPFGGKIVGCRGLSPRCDHRRLLH